jgi:hypothetical protein
LKTGTERVELRDAALQLGRSGPGRRVRGRPAELERAEIDVRALDETEDGVGVPEQHFTGVGERDGAPPFRPVDQAVADPPLEDRDLLADRGLREAEPRGRAAERSLTGDCPQRREMAELDAGPRTERAERSGAVFVGAGSQPPFCFPPAWVCAMSKDPAILGG